MKIIFEEKHYDVTEVSEILGISVTSVHNYIKNGSLLAAKVGGRWLVKECDIKMYLDNASTGTKKSE